MSDYLNNLVARTVRGEGTIKPRLASLFEPLSPAGWALPVGMSSTDASSFAESLEQFSTPTHNAASDAARTFNPSAHNAPRHQQTDTHTAQRQDHTRPLPEATTSSIADDARARWQSAPRPETALPVTLVHADEGRAANNRDAGAHVREATLAAHAVDERSLMARVAALEAGAARRSQPGDDVRAAPQLVAPQTAVPRVTPPAAGQHSAAPDEPPRINVHIGRVEVRAVTNAPPAASPAPAPSRPPTRTLEDYLRQRERKRR